MTVAVGDTVFLEEYLINTRVYGVVVPPGTPPEFWATYEIQSDQGTLTMAAVIGPTGPAGADAFAMLQQTDPYDSPDELPNTLTDTVADIGKYWVFDDLDSSGNVIGSSLWVWYGTSYRRLMLGSPGPPGPVPIITPTVTLIPNGEASNIVVGGTPLHPDMAFNIESLPGPTGPAADLALAPDVDFTTTAPTAGDLLGTTGRTTSIGGTTYQVWTPVSISQLVPGPFSMPENAFTSFSGLSQRAAIGSFTIPPQSFNYAPIVWGHIGAFGLELSATPLQIGCEVLLNDPTSGQQIGRGFGNSLGEVNVMPHYSTNSVPGAAITPTNGIGAVAAGASSTIYINLYNDGNIGVYQFSPTDAQLMVLLMPVP